MTSNPYNLNFGMRIVKYMLLVINCMFMITAILIMLVGTAIQAIFTEFSQFIDAHFFSPPTLLVAVACIMLIVSTFGCIGAMKESTLLINLYGVLLFCIFILEISAAIAAFCLQGEVRSMLIRTMKDSINSYWDDPIVARDVDYMQNGLICCGIFDADDWEKVDKGRPPSCCETFSADLKYCEKDYDVGCLSRMHFIISQSAMLIATGASTVAFVQFLGVLCAFMLAKTIRRNKSIREARRWQLQQNLGIVANKEINDHQYTQLEKTGDKLERNDPITYTANSPSVN